MAATAAKAAQGLQAIGGVGSLTEKELKAVQKTLQDGIAAFDALGKKAPADVQKMADAVASAQKGTSAFGGALGQVNQVLGLFGISLGIGAIVGFGKELLGTADAIVRVADTTGLTTTEVQKLQFIAEQSGNSLEQLTTATTKLQRGLGSGDQGVVKAVQLLGLNFDQL